MISVVLLLVSIKLLPILCHLTAFILLVRFRNDNILKISSLTMLGCTLVNIMWVKVNLVSLNSAQYLEVSPSSLRVL